MTYLKVLVGKLGSVNRLSARTISIRKVAALDHELGNDAMEHGSCKNAHMDE